METISRILVALSLFLMHVEELDHLVFKIGEDGKAYWYENGIVQGTFGDPKNIMDGIYHVERGREIYDPATDGWYWLDAIFNGARATSKEAWIPYIYQDEAPGSTSGKWVRYNEYGKMEKGWKSIEGSDILLYPSQAFNRYYYDPVTGEMAKGKRLVQGTEYAFDEMTGVLKADQKAWRKAYNEKAVERIDAWSSTHGFFAGSHAGIAYLDNDAMPEMYISFLDPQTGESFSELYAFDGSQALLLGTFDKSPVSPKGEWPFTGSLSYTEGENLFSYSSRKEQNNAIIVTNYLSCIENGSIQVLHMGTYTASPETEETYGYALDGKPADKEAYDAFFAIDGVLSYEGDACAHFFAPDPSRIQPGAFANDSGSVVLFLQGDGSYRMEEHIRPGEEPSFVREGIYMAGGYTWFEQSSVDDYTGKIGQVCRIYLGSTYYIARDNDTILYGTTPLKRVEQPDAYE